MMLPTLFKKTSIGNEQEWTIGVEASTIITRFGKVGGKIQETRDEIKEGKNTGKSNETSPKVQALAEAQSQWEKKLKKGYCKSLADAKAGVEDSAIQGGYFPMLAHSYDKRGDNITFPAFMQPKLDGHRCTSDIQGDTATLWSRGREPITGLPHINAALRALGLLRARPDGELYNHKYHNDFEKLSHFCRSPSPEPGHEVMQYHIYDAFMPDVPFKDRLSWLQANIPSKSSTIHLVKTIEVADEDEMMLAFEEFEVDGYEGAIIRNAAGLYLSAPPSARSVDLQKLKKFMDAEFKVIGVEEGRGKLAGHAIFVCKLPESDTEFRAKMKGPQSELKKYFEDPSLSVGRELTVKFQGYTKKNKVPRFPVAWRFAEKL